MILLSCRFDLWKFSDWKSFCKICHPLRSLCDEVFLALFSLFLTFFTGLQFVNTTFSCSFKSSLQLFVSRVGIFFLTRNYIFFLYSFQLNSPESGTCLLSNLNSILNMPSYQGSCTWRMTTQCFKTACLVVDTNITKFSSILDMPSLSRDSKNLMFPSNMVKSRN